MFIILTMLMTPRLQAYICLRPTCQLDMIFNLMAQYRPEYKAHDYPAIARRLTNEEWRQAVTWAGEAGLENVRT